MKMKRYRGIMDFFPEDSPAISTELQRYEKDAGVPHLS